jgi:hypothetical protein
MAPMRPLPTGKASFHLFSAAGCRYHSFNSGSAANNEVQRQHNAISENVFFVLIMTVFFVNKYLFSCYILWLFCVVTEVRAPT